MFFLIVIKVCCHIACDTIYIMVGTLLRVGTDVRKKDVIFVRKIPNLKPKFRGTF